MQKTLTRWRPLILALAVLGILMAAVFFYRPSILSSRTSDVLGKSDFLPQNETEVNKSFEIPIRTKEGEQKGAIKVTLTTADRVEHLLIQGKRAKTVTSKDFLVLNMEIDNPTNNQLRVKPVDFIRMVDASERTFAPDLHNDSIKVEPISIRRTRVSFVVPENQTDFKFLLGEINGSRQTVEIKI